MNERAFQNEIPHAIPDSGIHHPEQTSGSQGAEPPLTAADPETIDLSVYRDETVAMIAHELRSPLAAMSNPLEICRTDTAPLMATKARQILDRQLRKALHLVDDLLDIPRLSRIVPVIDEGAIDLARVIAETAEELGYQFRARSQVLVLDLPANPVLVRGDALRLEQIVVNLLDNSSKYSPTGGHITSKLTRESGWAMLSIQDDGLGIHTDDLPYVFDLFFRAKHPLDRLQGGLGIGLALVRQFVELHGGTIDVRSDGHNRGSEFMVRLPLLTARAANPGAPVDQPPTGHP